MRLSVGRFWTVVLAVCAVVFIANIFVNMFETLSLLLILSGCILTLNGILMSGSKKRSFIIIEGILLITLGIVRSLYVRALFIKYLLPTFLLVVGFLVVVGILAWRRT